MHFEDINPNKKALGLCIRKKRMEKGLTQQKLAELIGIQPKSMSFIERGINYPSSENIFSLAQILELSLDEYIFGYSKFDKNFCIDEINQMLSDLSSESKAIIVATLKTMCIMLNNEEQKRKSKNKQ